ncbi:LCP family protein [Aerococcaceae bacterium zg-ZUI334]|uniref:LCP family protein n=1 Tax=Aerococcaceae bacterium zg-252 TaxID=2796928 RepID=UPI001B8F18A5|nr:LCP family protein [Aerococcaceae bacterium zg-ZUI334]
MNFKRVILMIVLSLCFFVGKIEAKTNILLLGSDAGYESDRKEELVGSRSDAIVIATIDEESKTITFSSIPRDSLVAIPGRGEEKLTHAFAYGGKELTIQTIEEWLDVKFDHYVVANMPGFINIIDTLGGVTVKPPMTFNWWNRFFFEKDVEQKLDGEHALAYARERFTSGGDYARQARMREMLIKVREKLISENNIGKYEELFNNRYKFIDTDLNFDQIKDLYAQYFNSEYAPIEFQLAGDGYTADGLGYVDAIREDSLAELRKIIQ